MELLTIIRKEIISLCSNNFSIQKSKDYFLSWTRFHYFTVIGIVFLAFSITAFNSFPAVYNIFASKFGLPLFDGTENNISFIPFLTTVCFLFFIEIGNAFSISHFVLAYLKKSYFMMLLFSLLILCSGYFTYNLQQEGTNEYILAATEKPILSDASQKEKVINSKDSKIESLNKKIDLLEKQGIDLSEKIDKLINSKSNYFKSSYSGKLVLKENAKNTLDKLEQNYYNWNNSKDSKLKSIMNQITALERSSNLVLTSIDLNDSQKVSNYESDLNRGNKTNYMINLAVVLVCFFFTSILTLYVYFKKENGISVRQKYEIEKEKEHKKMTFCLDILADMEANNVKHTVRDVARLSGYGESNTRKIKQIAQDNGYDYNELFSIKK